MLCCDVVQLVASKDSFNAGLLEHVADDMVAASDLGEVIYGGDLTQITEAMHEAVNQIDVHVHKVMPDDAAQLLRKVSNVSTRLAVMS